MEASYDMGDSLGLWLVEKASSQTDGITAPSGGCSASLHASLPQVRCTDQVL